MNLVTSAQIGAPKLKVSPPTWVFVLFWVFSVAVIVALSQLVVTDTIIKYTLIGICTFVILGVLRNQLKGNFLVTIQANKDGLYFQTSDTDQYYYVPWKNVGLIEKAIFPMNSRGLRIEITGELVEQIKNSKKIGNIRTENGHTFVYSIPQLHNRDKLIEQFKSFRRDFPH